MNSCRRALTRSASATLVIGLTSYCLETRLLQQPSGWLQQATRRVDKLQGAARVIFGGDRRGHVTPLQCYATNSIYCEQETRLYYKVMKILAPSYIKDLYVLVTTVSTDAGLQP